MLSEAACPDPSGKSRLCGRVMLSEAACPDPSGKSRFCGKRSNLSRPIGSLPRFFGEIPLLRIAVRLNIFPKYVTQAESLGQKIVSGLQPEDIIPSVLKRSVAPPFDMKGFQPFV